jgi:hypothetical protein
VKEITIALTDAQEKAFAERGIDLEAYIAREVERVSIEAFKFRVNRIVDKAQVDGSFAKAAESIDAVVATLDAEIEAKKPIPVPVPQDEPIEEVKP